MATGTVRLHRVLRAPPQRIYKALLDPDAMAKWLPPHGFTGKVHHLKAEDFGAELTPELRAQEERLRAEVEGAARKPR